MDSAWRDWVIVDWGAEEGKLPCHLMGFVDLRALPPNFEANYPPSGPIRAGIYAIVEVTKRLTAEEEEVKSELFVPYEKEVGGFTGKFVSHNKYYLADVEAFVGPAAVIPDLEGKTNCYLLLKDRTQWKNDFESWLESPHKNDENIITEEDGIALPSGGLMGGSNVAS